MPCCRAEALELADVQVRGVDALLEDNVRAHLSLESLTPAQRANLTETRLSYLLRATPEEVHAGLEPFGYYQAKVDTQVTRAGTAVTVRVTISPGEPVRVRGLALAVEGPAADDPVVAASVAQFSPREREIFDHGRYERGKNAITRALGDRGYFDAEPSLHRVAVTREMRAADIELGWRSGRRYALGAVRFEGSPLRAGVLEPLVPWKDGDPYDQKRLLDLQQSLADADYFSGITLLPEPEKAVDGRVPVLITVVPAKRSVYNLGLRYGTDTGAGINARMDRRWLNSRGHKLTAELNLAQFRRDFITQYRVPAFAWLDGWYSYSIAVREEEIEEVTSQYVDLAAARSGRWRNWNLLAGLNFKRERFDALDEEQLQYSTLVYPSLWGQWKQTDDINVPRAARGVTVELRGGAKALGSDVDFLQLRAEGRYIRGLGPSNRLLLRGELGTTYSDQFELFPPSMRFYAGGDRSVRGYDYKEIGDRVGDRVFGGKHLAVLSAEVEHMFTPVWGAAAFVDAGDAFDEQFDAEIGIGAGLRWRSPVGPVRVDIAHGLGDANQSVRLHVSVGPDL